MSLDQQKIWHSTYEALVQAVQVAERTHTPNFTGPRGHARKIVNALLSTLNVIGVEGVKPDPHLHGDIRDLYADGSMGENVMPVVEIDGQTFKPGYYRPVIDRVGPPQMVPIQLPGMSIEEVRSRLNPAPPAFQEQYMQQHLNEPATDPGYWDRKPERTAEQDFVEGEQIIAGYPSQEKVSIEAGVRAFIEEVVKLRAQGKSVSQEPEILLQSDPRMAHAHIYQRGIPGGQTRRCVRCLEWEPEENLDDLLEEPDLDDLLDEDDYGTLEGNAKERF